LSYIIHLQSLQLQSNQRNAISTQSNANMSTNANSEFSNQNTETDDIPQGGDTIDNSYVSGGNGPVPVLKDETPVEQPNDALSPDSDETLGEYTFASFVLHGCPRLSQLCSYRQRNLTSLSNRVLIQDEENVADNRMQRQSVTMPKPSTNPTSSRVIAPGMPSLPGAERRSWST
jgi:hypothetical protein